MACLWNLMACLWNVSLDVISTAWNIRSIQREEWKAALRYDGKYASVAMQVKNIFIRPGLVHIVNLVVVLAVNGVYVIYILKVSYRAVFLVQALLSAFKIVWVNGYIPLAMKQLQYKSSQSLFKHQVALMLVVYILGPGIASIGANSNCFYYAVVRAKPISSSFQVLNSGYSCTVVFNSFRPLLATNIDNSEIVCSLTSSYVNSKTVPPFVYSYQCGSSFLVDYIPVLFYAYLYSAILLPLVRFGLLHVSSGWVQRRIGQWLFRHLIYRTIFDINGCIEDYNSLVSPYQMHALPSDVDLQMANLAGIATADSSSFRDTAAAADISRSTTRSSFMKSVSQQPNIMDKPLFNGTTVVTKRIVDFCVLLTFGLACPLLAITVAISVLANNVTWILMIGKFVCNVGDNNIVAFTRLEQSFCDGLLRGSLGGLWLVIPVISLFWSLIFFDMVGDVYGAVTGGIFVIVTFAVVPAVLYIVYRLRKRSALLKTTGRMQTLQEFLGRRFNSRSLSNDQDSRSKETSTELWIHGRKSLLPVIPSAQSNSEF
jgi:hypothetical protein